MPEPKIMTEAELKDEKLKCVEKWGNLYDLKCVDGADRATLAMLLENQNIMNQVGSQHDSKFKEASLPLVHRIYSTLVARKLVSVQPLLGPKGPVFFLKFVYEIDPDAVHDLDEKEGVKQRIKLVVESEEVEARSRKLKTFHAIEDDINIEELGTTISNEITREIVTDLRLNAGTVGKFDLGGLPNETIKERYEALCVKVVEVSTVIHRKTLHGGVNWIYTSPEIAGIFTAASTRCFVPPGYVPDTDSDRIYYEGTVNNRWGLYVDTLFPKNEILLGYRGDSYMDAGYYYCPYIPLVTTKPRALTRYGKKMLKNGGPKFYARITVEGLET